MPTTVQQYRVFIATPSGLEDVRQSFVKALADFNDVAPHGSTVRFEAIGWEDTTPGFGRPQARINEDIAMCDYFVLVLWDRWGSPTGPDYTSGCAEEFALAQRLLEDPTKPMQDIVVFFRKPDERQLRDPGDQLRGVLRFRNELDQSKRFLFEEFQDTDRFRRVVQRCVSRWTRRHDTAPEHIELVRQGTALWNSWRQANKSTRPGLSGAKLRGRHLPHIDLSNADLVGADLTGADLTFANLSGADLRGTTFQEANLYRANLRGADLTSCIFHRTHLREADLHQASLGGSVLAEIDLRETALNSVLHAGPSEVGVDTVKLSHSNVHFKYFLRGAGVPDVFVEYLVDCARSLDPELAFSLLQSVFISYAESDRRFAEKLRDGLLRAGVRTWMFSDDAELGVPLHRVMRAGVNDQDRTILICSESSLHRVGVLNELEETLAREARDGGRPYLIPVRLDDYVINGWKPTAPDVAEAVRHRVIADFRDHEDPARFHVELAKLVAALKKPGP